MKKYRNSIIFNIKSQIVQYILKFLFFFTHFFLSQYKKITPTQVKKILVFGQMGIGNMILFAPALKALRKYMPESHITLLVGSNGADVLLKESKIFDEIEYYNFKDKTFKNITSLYKRIRNSRYDLIISNFNGATHILCWALFFSRAKWRLGHISSDGWNNLYDKYYNIKVPMKPKSHEIERNISLIEAIDPKVKPIERKLFITINSKDYQFIEEYIQKNQFRTENILIGVQIGTNPNDRWKQWKIKRYAELIKKIIDYYNVTIFALGAPNEKDMIKQAFVNIKENLIITAGSISLMQTAALISKLNLLICNDSGLMHVAAALSTPIIAIYGPTDFRRTAPQETIHQIIRKDLNCSPCFKLNGPANVLSCSHHNCLEFISVNDVFEAVKKSLQQTNALKGD